MSPTNAPSLARARFGLNIAFYIPFLTLAIGRARILVKVLFD